MMHFLQTSKLARSMLRVDIVARLTTAGMSIGTICPKLQILKRRNGESTSVLTQKYAGSINGELETTRMNLSSKISVARLIPRLLHVSRIL